MAYAFEEGTNVRSMAAVNVWHRSGGKGETVYVGVGGYENPEA